MMEDSDRIPLTAVDRIADGNGLQMIKAAIPYFPAKLQKTFSLYIKCMEINNMLTYYNSPLSACSDHGEHENPEEILNELRSYATDEQRQTMDRALNLFQTLKMYQECKDLLL